ncbi:hypothetical protein EDD22DRAFT_827858 [Suillus occidentalis]|nr:hypothetical protein EDD22DRAFT_827858 [Suillus occidentalis]
MSLAVDALENLPTEFIEPLHISQRQNIVDSFARLDFLTEGTKQPKLFQLKCLMSLLASRHVVVRAATGAGKTLAMILPLLLSPNKIAITVTPLKLLQKDHVNEFVQDGIPSIAINHDTPHDKTLWNHISAGHYKNLLVASAELRKKPFLQLIMAGFCETEHRSKSITVIRKPRSISRIARTLMSSLRPRWSTVHARSSDG